MLDLSSALEKLEALDDRKAQLLELRFFLALSMDEAADVPGSFGGDGRAGLKFSRS